MHNIAPAFPWFFGLFVLACIALLVRNSTKSKKSKTKKGALERSNSTSDLNVAGSVEFFPIIPNKENKIYFPGDSEILSVKGDGNIINMWAVVPEKLEPVTRIFIAVSTGEIVPENHFYIGTAFIENEAVHVFELK
ncbi:hypothetical protein DAP22_22825 [Salmonella enterica subsp. enterica serovar Enteritidis]|uniref:DUF7352 domain-containing protein n=1 Tax=Escherichia coli TaxID=562 RepID=UPI000DE4CC8B|nr:hypothetical protein [Escherichia coli]EDQ9490368.1 hypothetical protein [Salmonella enterica subsp. enterica]EEE8220460.1 hypothetical protein [Salmonella enterica subsp. enterica serovar Enteritidis]EHI7455499.1 hypothetical protein [Salmonella enterica]HCM4208630.1 hypothetical protein [Salmonella enterica subsp. enterica serovar Saintpaul]HDS2567750.1 hypothetical protein [Klebsiella pneumoniae subsp. pneumoniae]